MEQRRQRWLRALFRFLANGAVDDLVLLVGFVGSALEGFGVTQQVLPLKREAGFLGEQASNESTATQHVGRSRHRAFLRNCGPPRYSDHHEAASRPAPCVDAAAIDPKICRRVREGGAFKAPDRTPE